MAEEVEQESTGKSFKGILITLVSTVTLGVGGWVTTKLTGGDKEETPTQQVAQPSIIINNSQQQQAAGGTKTVIVKEKATEAKPQPAKPKKEADEFKEKPAQW
jgi:hypothetical protein